MSGPERLLEVLRNKGAPLQGWEESITAVRRELFLPGTVETPHGTVSRDANPDAWLTAVYGDLPLTTQVNDGRPTVDVDPVLVEQAAKNVRAAGYSPHVVCGDGAAGWPHGAPYDRIIAGYTVPEIPYAWVEQAPGGRIVAPWGGSFFSHSFAALDVSDGEAHGRFSGYPAFMRSRTARPPRGFLGDFLHHQDEAVETRTATDPLEIARDADAQFWIGLLLPDAWHMEIEAEDGSDEVTWWLLSDDRSSWAAADHVPGRHEYVIAQYGPRRLWDEALHAWQTWRRHGSPPRDRAGITVTPGGQDVWLDEPSHVIASAKAPSAVCRVRDEVGPT